MIKNTYWEYQHGLVSGLEFARQHYIGEGLGEIREVQITPKRSLYIIKRDLFDYDDVNYTEYKVCDLDSERNAIVDKKKVYGSKRPTLVEYWNNLLLDPEMQNYIDSRAFFGD